jgi:hypothetical protein
MDFDQQHFGVDFQRVAFGTTCWNRQDGEIEVSENLLIFFDERIFPEGYWWSGILISQIHQRRGN